MQRIVSIYQTSKTCIPFFLLSTVFGDYLDCSHKISKSQLIGSSHYLMAIVLSQNQQKIEIDLMSLPVQIHLIFYPHCMHKAIWRLKLFRAPSTGFKIVASIFSLLARACHPMIDIFKSNGHFLLIPIKFWRTLTVLRPTNIPGNLFWRLINYS